MLSSYTVAHLFEYAAGCQLKQPKQPLRELLGFSSWLGQCDSAAGFVQSHLHTGAVAWF